MTYIWKFRFYLRKAKIITVFKVNDLKTTGTLFCFRTKEDVISDLN